MVARALERVRADAAIDPTVAADEALAFLERKMSDLAALAIDSPNDAVRLGALKASIAAGIEYLDLLRVFGRLPRGAAEFVAQRDLPAIFGALAEVMQRHDVPDGAIREMLALSERHVGRPRGELAAA
jgi:hypothetical protein